MQKAAYTNCPKGKGDVGKSSRRFRVPSSSYPVEFFSSEVGLKHEILVKEECFRL